MPQSASKKQNMEATPDIMKIDNVKTQIVPKADYKNGIIYKLTNTSTGEVYIGSTGCSLKSRFCVHKSKQNCSASKKLFTDPGEVTCEIIEKYACASRKELNDREYHWMNQIECINKVTRKTGLRYDDPNYNRAYYRIYANENRDHINKMARNWYNNHADKIKKANNEKYKNDEKIRLAQIDRVKRYQKKIKDVKKYCPACKKEISKQKMYMHRKTKCHKALQEWQDVYEDHDDVYNFIWD